MSLHTPPPVRAIVVLNTDRTRALTSDVTGPVHVEWLGSVRGGAIRNAVVLVDPDGRAVAAADTAEALGG